jgi:hypothetical protein
MIWKIHSSFARGAMLRARASTCFDVRTNQATKHGGEPMVELGPLYRGSCLCGSVRYEVFLDGRPEASVRSVWEQTVRPDHFKLLSGEDTLSGHQFAGDQTQHFFCERCGLRSFSHHPCSADGAFYSVDLKALEPSKRALGRASE